MKLNPYPCPEHADGSEFYCDACVAAVEAEDDEPRPGLMDVAEGKIQRERGAG